MIFFTVKMVCPPTRFPNFQMSFFLTALQPEERVWKCHSDRKDNNRRHPHNTGLVHSQCIKIGLCVFGGQQPLWAHTARWGLIIRPPIYHEHFKNSHHWLLKHFTMRFRGYSENIAARYFYRYTIYHCSFSGVTLIASVIRASPWKLGDALCLRWLKQNLWLESDIMLLQINHWKLKQQQCLCMRGNSISFKFCYSKKWYFSTVCFACGAPVQTNVAQPTIFLDAESPLFTNVQKVNLISSFVSNKKLPIGSVVVVSQSINQCQINSSQHGLPQENHGFVKYGRWLVSLALVTGPLLFKFLRRSRTARYPYSELGCGRHPIQVHKLPQPASLKCKETCVYSALISSFCTFSDYPTLLAVGDDRNIDRTVNQNLDCPVQASKTTADDTLNCLRPTNNIRWFV